ncbi:MAG: hypothetical protein QXL14_04055 [Candidatus Aenigmatarchaeota archaeon]
MIKIKEKIEIMLAIASACILTALFVFGSKISKRCRNEYERFEQALLEESYK